MDPIAAAQAVDAAMTQLISALNDYIAAAEPDPVTLRRWMAHQLKVGLPSKRFAPDDVLPTSAQVTLIELTASGQHR